MTNNVVATDKISSAQFYTLLFLDNCHELGLEGTCFEPKEYLVWKETEEPEFYYEGAKTEVRPGIMQELTYMLIMGVVYYLVLIAVEKGLFKRILAWTSKAEKFAFKANSKDDDVSAERRRIENLVASRSIATSLSYSSYSVQSFNIK
jgi:hypothetical protein